MVEPQDVTLVDAGSSPAVHPNGIEPTPNPGAIAIGMTAALRCAKLQLHDDFRLQNPRTPPFSIRRGAMKTEETGIPREIAVAVARFANLVAPFFPAGALRMGGGTILQARWGHRMSFDADLFCDPGTYARTIAGSGPEIERAINSIADGVEEGASFVDQIASFCHIAGIEVTILPSAALIGSPTGRVVPNTTIETESTADILAAKLVHRMCGAGVIEPRDLFDLVAAERYDPNALREALGLLSDMQMTELSAALAMLPKRWASFSDKPLFSVDGDEIEVDAKSVRELFEHVRRERSPRDLESP